MICTGRLQNGAGNALSRDKRGATIIRRNGKRGF